MQRYDEDLSLKLNKSALFSIENLVADNNLKVKDAMQQLQTVTKIG